MSRFAGRDVAAPPDEEFDGYDPSHNICVVCGQDYSGTDSSGGHCRAPLPDGRLCCQSFGSNNAGDRHRVGPQSARRCLTPDEMTAKGWTQDERGAWRTPAPKTNPWKKETQ